jgi:hypothetical protein
VLEVQQLQALLALRKYRPAFELSLELIQRLAVTKPKESIPFPSPLSETDDTYVLIDDDSLFTYLILSLFHVAWCAFVKHSHDADGQNFLLTALFVFSQSIWEEAGYVLSQQLIQHVALRTYFISPLFLMYVNNIAILSQLPMAKHTSMTIANNVNAVPGSELARELRSGKVRFAKGQPVDLLLQFLDDFKKEFEKFL